MNINEAFFSVAVAGFEGAINWYERLVGREPDMVPNDVEVCWQLKEHVWMYVIKDAERAGKALLTLIVEDLEGHIVELIERRITVESTEDVPKYRKANFVDPEGNTIALVEVPAEQP